jgi:hypothetical protein
VLPVFVGVVGCVVVDDVLDRDPVGVSFPVDVLDVSVNVVVDDILDVLPVVVRVVFVVDREPVGVHIPVDFLAVSADVVVDSVLVVVVVDLVLESDKDKALFINNSAFPLSEALLEDDGEDDGEDNEVGAPVAPS